LKEVEREAEVHEREQVLLFRHRTKGFRRSATATISANRQMSLRTLFFLLFPAHHRQRLPPRRLFRPVIVGYLLRRALLAIVVGVQHVLHRQRVAHQSM
jgi:hypothetical protein